MAMTFFQEAWRSFLLDRFAPLVHWVQSQSEGLQDLKTVLSDYGVLIEKNKALVAENNALKTKLLFMKPLKTENKTLKKLLHLPVPEGYRRVLAKIILRSPDHWFSQIQIYAGFYKGLAEGQVVISEHGVIGKIKSVSQETANVELISQPDIAVSCYTENVEKSAVLMGQLPGEFSTLKYIQNHIQVTPGEKVFTSGTGGGYPADLLLGEVAQVKEVPGLPVPEVSVRLSAFETHLTHVVVLVPVAASKP